MNSKQKNTRGAEIFKKLPKQFTPGIGKRSQQIPIAGVNLEEKVSKLRKHWVKLSSKHPIVG